MKKIMVVDDEILVRIGIKSIVDWEANGYCMIAEAEDGVEALEKIEEEQPDIILTDLKMERMDGFQLMEQCARQYPAIRFVVLSSYNDFDNVKTAMKQGACDYIFKLTAKPEEILKILNEIRLPEQKKDELEADKIIRKNASAIKTRLIKSAVQRFYSNPEELMDEFAQMRLHTDFSGSYVVLYISIDREKGKADKANQLIKFSMENIMGEVMAQSGHAEVYIYDDEDFVIPVNCESGTDYQSLCKSVEASFQTILEYMKRYVGISVTGTLSPVCCGLAKLSEAVTCCQRLLGQRISRGGGTLYIYSGEERPEVGEIKRYIHDHLNGDLTISGAARLVNMSESYFSHVFKKEAGMSFVDYVTSMRMERAAALLQNPELLVGDVAERVGIGNPNYFSVLFKKAMGMSPNEYRTLHLKQNS